GLQRGPLVEGARLGLDRVDRVHDPHPDPRLPARGPPRRADAGGRLVATATAEHIGFRNQMRARWHALSEHQRWAVTIGVEVIVPLLGFALDHALGYGLAVLFTVLWCRRMPPLPWRLATEAGLVAVFLIAWLAGSANGSIPAVLAVCFALTWIP